MIGFVGLAGGMRRWNSAASSHSDYWRITPLDVCTSVWDPTLNISSSLPFIVCRSTVMILLASEACAGTNSANPSIS